MVPSSSITSCLVRQQELIHCHSKCDKLNTNTEENRSGLAQRTPVIPFFGWSQEERKREDEARAGPCLSLPSRVTEDRAALSKSSISVCEFLTKHPAAHLSVPHTHSSLSRISVKTGPRLLRIPVYCKVPCLVPKPFLQSIKYPFTS